MNGYDAYVFDWDGTLAQSHEVWLAIIRSQLSRYNVQLSDREIVTQVFGRYDEGMCELGVPAGDMNRLGKEVLAVGSARVPLVDLYPGVPELLQTLHMQGRKLAVVTATYREVMDMAVAKHGLLGLLDVVITGDEVPAQKPDPAGILAALAYMNVKPGRAIMLGDSKKDILAAHNAHVDSVLFYPPSHQTQHDFDELQHCKPTYTIRDWQELVNQLQ